jgi:hypothetical protein
MQYNCIGHKQLKFVLYSNIHLVTIQLKEGYNLKKNARFTQMFIALNFQNITSRLIRKHLGEYAKILEHILLVATLCLYDTKHWILEYNFHL